MCVAELAWLWDFPKARNRKGTRVVQIVWRQSLFDFKYINFKTLFLLAMQYWLRYQLTFIKLICYYVYFFYKLACFFMCIFCLNWFAIVYIFFSLNEGSDHYCWRWEKYENLSSAKILPLIQSISFFVISLIFLKCLKILIFFKFWNGMKKLIQMFHFMDNVLFIWWRRKRYKPIDFQFKISDSSNCTVLPSRQISMPSSTMKIWLY